MMRKGMIALSAMLLMVSVGCKKKDPKTGEGLDIQPTTIEPTPEDVTSRPEPRIQEDQRESPLSGDLPEVNAWVHDQGLIGDVFFAFDRAELEAEARNRLAQNARFLLDHTEFILTIEGHADERGTNDYNLALAERRANAARDYLVSLGVERNRLRTVSYGEERPFCTQSSESCWSQNRRAHFVVTGRTDIG